MVDFGLSQIVSHPTRKGNILDIFLTNRPDIFNSHVAKSVLKSDYYAVYINCAGAVTAAPAAAATKKRVKCYNRSAADLARLSQFFCDYNWNGLVLGIDDGTLSVDQAFADFTNVLHYALEHVGGHRIVTVRERDPPYITPPIKVLLRRRNKLLRQGKADSALAITKKVGKMIADVKSKLLSKATASDTKQLWQLLRSTRNWSSRVNSVSVSDAIGSTVTAEGLNAHFANIATDPNYSRDNIEDCLCCIDGSDLSSFVPFSEYFLTIVLSRIRPTSPGPEGIPFWLYRTCAPELGPIVAKLVNFSLSQHTVPRVWKTAHVTPVPKTSPVTGYGDLRPISVTSILSRTVEKLVVKNYLTSVLDCPLFHDQYAYKPTGSTTCALVDFTYRIHMLLESNQYVRCILIDFSKAFDMVDHAILARKLFSLQVPGFIIHWIISFLTDRTQAIKLGLSLSTLINRSIVQGWFRYWTYLVYNVCT